MSPAKQPKLTPLRVMKEAVKALEKLPCQYCLIGGHAASLYRVQERLTVDVDFAIVADDIKKSQYYAEKCIENIGLIPALGFIPIGPDEAERKRTCLITAKPTINKLRGIIDILLPELPWVEHAVMRAQYNKIDLKFAKVPVITPEDLIVAKCYSLRNSPDRFQDLDDLKALFTDLKDIDFDYLRESLLSLSLSVPQLVKKHIKGLKNIL